MKNSFQLLQLNVGTLVMWNELFLPILPFHCCVCSLDVLAFWALRAGAHGR